MFKVGQIWRIRINHNARIRITDVFPLDNSFNWVWSPANNDLTVHHASGEAIRQLELVADVP